MEASAEADTGCMWNRGEKGVVGPTLQGQLLSRCPERWKRVSPKQTRTNRDNLGSRRWTGKGKTLTLPNQGDLLFLLNMGPEGPSPVRTTDCSF